MTAEGHRPAKRRSLARRLGIIALAVVLVLSAGGVALWIWKPWAPEMRVAEPAASGEWVRADGVLGHWYPAEDADDGPGVLLVSGSEGGLQPRLVAQATALQAEGFSVLALAYFGAEGQSDALVDIPLETFDAGIDWLARQPEVDPERIGMVGGSKGAEAALLMASRRDRLAAVVANVPSHVVWQGLDLVRPWRMGTDPRSSWSDRGQPLPYASLASGALPPETLTEIYQQALDAGVPPASRIDIDAIEAPVLLTCGGRDTVWPSCPMAEEIAAAASDKQHLTVLDYPDAGHFVQGPPGDLDPAQIESGGGTAQANAAARAQAWPQLVAFLKRSL
ncbi:hypothetical protein MLP_02450 [Microlunatus phosphovorus NM-1]|uniref:BAAT/Acyl-CoA thioester hydrolase C-terminal domain-containing protein n=1 Tax=Microlunatus phosphovorus (strain ATCC 700054 / DSM 10555 / JCM 9379 / NBRC 101784 / NCIMB 13414 / VKM Ac-1990 / NM-1) TaxID=1032480 RepID=F5XHW4_MICPN|nr:acyl-CoA thioester hydrolase/BAAT C-terminal domain-containing protein [Microlunatus phosphovorus]BAK33259.1 hypothetical protein MLP_02450 [Microlunatus phosphovorus NM-1]